MSCLITWIRWSININIATSLNVRQPQPQCNSNHHHLTTNSHCHSNTQALGDMQEGGRWKVGNDQNGPKQCETCHLGPRWVCLVFFFFVLFYINGHFIVFIGCIYDLSMKGRWLEQQGELKQALGEFFCFLFRIILY